MIISPDLKYKELVLVIEAVKNKYKVFVASFLYFEPQKQYEYVSNLKKQVYALQFEEWKKDKIWEYLNDYEEYEELLKFV